ncbi:hypothetical protein Aduo_001512 [Ancylostoma duodenale]
MNIGFQEFFLLGFMHRMNESHDRQQPESEAEARPDWTPRQEDGRADTEAGADSGTAAVEADVRQEWPDSDSEVDPNAILPDLRHRQRRPDWSATAEARGRQEQVEDEVEVTPAAHPSESIYYADSHTQDTTAERSEQSAGEERQETDAEGWRAVGSQQPQEQPRHPGQPFDPRRAMVEEQRRAQLEERRRAQEEAQRRAQEDEQRRAQEEEQRRTEEEDRRRVQLDRSRQMEEYEVRKRAHEEEYRRVMEQRRLKAQRRRAELERRRAELIARQVSEARRDSEAERAQDLPEMLDPEDPRFNAYRKMLTPEQLQQYL